MKTLELKPFNPETFIGKGWSIESQDQNSLVLTEIDFSKVAYEHALKDGENYITGEEKLKRMSGAGVLLDARIARALYEEKDQKTLKELYTTQNIECIEFVGTVLCDPDGGLYFLYLSRRVDGSWGWYSYWLGFDRDRRDVSPLLASSSEPLDPVALTLETLHSRLERIERIINQTTTV